MNDAYKRNKIKSLLEDAVELRFPCRQNIRDLVLIELATSLALKEKEFLQNALDSDSDDTKLVDSLSKNEYFWSSIEEITNYADWSLERSRAEDKQEDLIQRWKHQPVYDLTPLDNKREDESANMEQLANCVVSYCEAKWAHSPSLELWLARKLIHAEAFAFAQVVGLPINLKSFRYWWNFGKLTLKWFIGLAVSFSIGESYGLALGVLTYVAWHALFTLIDRNKFVDLKKQAELLLILRSVYKLSLDPAHSPIELSGALKYAEDKGAVWPVGLRTIVDKVLHRNRLLWREK